MQSENLNYIREDDYEVKLVESIMERNPCYVANRKIRVEGIMLHSNHSPQPSAKVMIHNWNQETFSRACVHAFIDGSDGTVYQTLPWNHRGWHAFGSANNNFIGIEICEPGFIHYTNKNQFTVENKARAIESAEKTYQSAAELCAQLCVKYNLDPMTAICSHTEGHKKGIASDRIEPEHLWDGLGLQFTMDTFRQAVRDEMDKIVRDPVTKEIPEEPIKVKVTEVTPIEDTSEPAETSEKVNTFKVRVDVDRLRIRSGPGVDFSPTGKYTGKGVFEIVEVQGKTSSSQGWGKLQNGSGWICLDYVAAYND